MTKQSNLFDAENAKKKQALCKEKFALLYNASIAVMFQFNAAKYGVTCRVRFDVQLPLADYCDEDELFGHLLAQQSVPMSFRDDVRSALRKFIVSETQKFYDDLIEKRLVDALKHNEIEFSHILSRIENNKINNEHTVAFEEQFKYLMRSSTVEQLAEIVRAELDMSDKMSTLLRARDFEFERMERKREKSIKKTFLRTDSIGAGGDDGKGALASQSFSQESYDLAMLNERIFQLSKNYAHQIEALQTSQRHAYRAFIGALYRAQCANANGTKTNGACDGDSLLIASRKFFARFLREGIVVGDTSAAHIPDASNTTDSDSSGFGDRKNSSRFSFSSGGIKKSLSCDSRIMRTAPKMASFSRKNKVECFTIYIGAQMKSMHNARILLCDRLSQLCENAPDEEDDAPAPTNSGNFRDDAEILELNGFAASQRQQRRLYVLMSLYGRELTGVILIVGRDPMHHVRQRSSFARLCERSAELHFEPLEEQLKRICDEVVFANRLRRKRKQNQERNENLDSYDSYDVESNEKNENLLHPGDVYITCHSNLSSAQVVFHLVTDDVLETSDISSRHACLAGLRNVVRAASRFAVKNISIPLLLVESMNESMTVAWCLARAELVFKCLKGFLMDVAASGTAGASAAAAAGDAAACASGGGGAWGGGGGALGGTAGATQHNVNFALPRRVSENLFSQLVDLFSNIFHLVPSLSVSN